MAGMVTKELNKFGPFGKYNNVTVVANGSGNNDFSSGSIGAAAFMISGSSIAGRANLARGGTMELGTLAIGVVHEIGLASVYSDNATTFILVLQR